MSMHPDSWWVGHLAVTVAAASSSAEPRPILKSALREFLAERPAGCELARIVRDAQKGKLG